MSNRVFPKEDLISPQAFVTNEVPVKSGRVATVSLL